jgi:hypothetical protein
MLADPFTGFVIGQTDPGTGQYSEYAIGGTSLACPLFAATITLAQQHSHKKFGFVNPLLYKHRDAFRDIAPLSTPQAVVLPLSDGSVAAIPFDYQDQTIKTAVEKIAELRERYLNVSIQDKGRRFNTDLLEAIELGNLLDLAEVMAVSALARKESRGGHYREDYPNRDDVNFMRHTMAYREVGDDGTESIRLDYKPVVQTRYQPMERKY